MARDGFGRTFEGKNVPIEFQEPLAERLGRYKFTHHGMPSSVNPNATLFDDRPDLERYIMDRFAIIGTAEQCHDQLANLIQDARLDGVWLSLASIQPETQLERWADALSDLLASDRSLRA